MKHFSALLLLLFSILIFSSSAAQAQPCAPAEEALPTSTGYLGSVEMGFLYGKITNPFNNPPTYMASPSVQIFNGYRAHRLFAIGGTVGFDFYDNILITPIALGLRGELLKTSVSPFYSLDAGYGASFLSGRRSGERPDGGWMLNPALGLRVQTGNNTAYLFSMGYKQQRVDTESMTGWGVRVNERITYKRLSLRLGFMF
ncbi:hypothetical protein FVR03_07485 [Pontibacter qinzhouensis]|uniref:Porin family protein n=1 Tax=Pontibacter qinzhouensis TaxID=2603253 RepID=A0A5C8KB86_9BACT|nr:hypothetical protein [Pontibacter qinzhouensis]TXK48913.1 hypothetical protein FVR03_07485 [Pontibacter qinzhouensis]